MPSVTLAFVMGVAELIGAALYVLSPQGPIRNLVCTFGLAFALSIVLVDIVPDATEDFLPGFAFFAAGLAIGAALIFWGGLRGRDASNAGAIASMGLHNICEGIVIAASAPAITPLVFTAAVAHKLPEGMVVFSLADRLDLSKRWILAVAMSFLIPIGTLIEFPEDYKKPLLGLAAGVLAVALAKALIVMFGLGSGVDRMVDRRAAAVVAVGGAVIAGLTTLVV